MSLITWKITPFNPPPPTISCKFQFHCSKSFIFDAQFNGSTSETNTGLPGDGILEEFGEIDPVCLEEWMEAIDKYKADVELRHYYAFCMLAFLSFIIS